MSGSQAGPPMGVSDIYANARRLGAYLKEKSPEIDEVRGYRPKSPPEGVRAPPTPPDYLVCTRLRSRVSYPQKRTASDKHPVPSDE